MEIFQLKKLFPFYSSLSTDIQEYLANHAVARYFEEGEFLTMEGESCFYFPVVISGVVRVYKLGENGREITLYRIHSGESCILTTTCILNRNNFPAMATVTQRAYILLIPGDKVNSWFLQNEIWRNYLLKIISHRVFQIIETVENVTFKSVEKRLAEYILSSPNKVISKTHQEFAFEIGTAREVVSRILKEWQTAGLVQLKRGIVIVLNEIGIKKILF